MQNKRDYNIDVLRFVAIVCIVIAHTRPPAIVFEVRNFDVSLMVLLIGVSFYLSQKKKPLVYSDYIKKRFNRLIVSTWKFLLLFFLFFYIVSIILNQTYYFELEKVLRSFTLNGGIPYIWIMYVFFIVAIMSPLLLKLSRVIKSNRFFFVIIISVYLIYHYLVILFHYTKANEIFDELLIPFIIQPLGYCIIAAIGIRLKSLKANNILIGCLVFFSVFVSYWVWNDFASIQSYKFPPTLYYMSYGLCVSFALYYCLLSYSVIRRVMYNKFVFYFSRTSLLLYFWHIIPIYMLKAGLPIISDYFLTRFLFVLSFAMFFTFLQDKYLNSLIKWFMDTKAGNKLEIVIRNGKI